MTVDPARSPAATELAARLGTEFTDPELLAHALTHRSWCAEHPGFESNERLEFLGDAVLGLAVTDHIFETFADMPEGELAKLRASVVSAAALAGIAGDLDLGAALRLGKGEDGSGGRSKPSILADALEAVFGAIYLDAGLDAARPVILRLLEGPIAAAAAGPGHHDFKTQLQELAARMFEELPMYMLSEEGPDHQKRFFAAVRLGGTIRGQGEGRSKKQAEQAAAEAAYRSLANAEAEAANHSEDDNGVSGVVSPPIDGGSEAESSSARHDRISVSPSGRASGEAEGATPAAPEDRASDA